MFHDNIHATSATSLLYYNYYQLYKICINHFFLWWYLFYKFIFIIFIFQKKEIFEKSLSVILQLSDFKSSNRLQPYCNTSITYYIFRFIKFHCVFCISCIASPINSLLDLLCHKKLANIYINKEVNTNQIQICKYNCH